MTDNNEALNRSLGRIEGKQDLVLARLDAQAREQEVFKARLDTLDDRMDGIDKKLAYWAGGAAVVMTGLTLFKDKLLNVFA